MEPHVKASYEKAQGYLEKMTPLEESLLVTADTNAKAAIYRSYLDLEVNEIKDPARIQALYERIVAEMPLVETFWIDYCHFVDRQFKTADTSFSLFQRAVRNCSWNSTLWADYIFAAERYEKEHGFISGTFYLNNWDGPLLIMIFCFLSLGLVEKAFGAGLASAADYKAVWLAFIEYLVRKCNWDNEEQIQQVRESFTRATDHLEQSNFTLLASLLYLTLLNDCHLMRFVSSNSIRRGRGYRMHAASILVIHRS